ncbi:hypothetical protein BCR36DRAFT_411959 [Piromyces finnis]|uniref:Uncharacterized protein n=1 Tax=Piromyces finnis TaxID=1754191 RepID=A0A1Y1VCW3_9FUNG|nr:hypothetical protein BCR36DRAFT_411959 [Piromyces finnis]|eukprot:ORX51499.1 hypothetical protein BCR36DRAFT_411959 [Piromyces finnis]
MKTCKKSNAIGYEIPVILKFINEYMKPYESVTVAISPKDKDNEYLSKISSFYHYLIKYKPCIEYARKKYILFYNVIALNNSHFFRYICSRISFFPSVICFNGLSLASKVGLVECFNFFTEHTHMIQYSDGDKDFSFIKEKNYFDFLLNACQGGHAEVINKLFEMEKSSFISKPINTIAHSNTAFDTACENGHLKIVKLLIHRPEMKNIDSWDNAMKKIIDLHHFDVALYLMTEVNHGNKEMISNNTRNYAFRVAIKNKNYLLTDALLVDSKPITNINWSFSIKNALINEDVQLLRILLKHIAHLNNKEKIVNMNITNSIMKLVVKKPNSEILPLMKKIPFLPIQKIF